MVGGLGALPCSVGSPIRSAYHAALLKIRFPDEDRDMREFHPPIISLIISEQSFYTSNARSIIPWVGVPGPVLKTAKTSSETAGNCSIAGSTGKQGSLPASAES